MTHETEPASSESTAAIVPEDFSGAPPSGAGIPTADVAAIRELVLRAHPEVVPELITGHTVDALLASIEPAEAAFRRISASLRESTPAPPATPTVPAGGDRPMPIDPDRIPTSEKIRRGLAHR